MTQYELHFLTFNPETTIQIHTTSLPQPNLQKVSYESRFKIIDVVGVLKLGPKSFYQCLAIYIKWV